MKFLRNFNRIFIGLVFIFSGFVKGIDPLGTMYRIEDYFIAYGTEWAISVALFLSIFLCTLEFVLGIVLVLNICVRQLSWILFLLLIFFTLLTLYDAIYNPVPDCGCFGDAIKLTNWATFYKNLILLAFVFIIFFSRKAFRSPFSKSVEYLITIVFAALFIGFSCYSYNHLPIIDFREWKTGNDMTPNDKEKVKIYLTYMNKETGEEKEYLSPDYPWQDSVWMSKWEFVDQRIDESEMGKDIELVIENEYGDDVTEDFIYNIDYQLLVIIHDLKKANLTAFTKIDNLFINADHDGYSLIVLTSNFPDEVNQFIQYFDPYLEFYYADDIVLITIIRSNPGLILMKNGVVLGKWHYNDFPDYSELKETFFKN